MNKDESKLVLFIFLGFVCGIAYITILGNVSIMPQIQNWYNNLPAYEQNYAAFPLLLRFLLYPIPFFPIIFGVGGGLYIASTKKED